MRIGTVVLLVAALLGVGVRCQAGTGKYVAAVGPSVTQWTYKSAESFTGAMLSAAAKALVDVPKSAPKVIVFPEHVGTWLVLADEPLHVFEAKTMDSAMTWMIEGSHDAIRDELESLRGGDPEGLLKRALILHKAPAMLQAYIGAFKAVAVKYNAWVVAGSIAAPEFSVDAEGAVKTRGTALYNTSMVFSPDGKIVRKISKVHLVPSEQGFLTPGRPTTLVPVRTPLGLLGVMVCADGWYPDAYKAYPNADILVQPSMLESLELWDRPWGGGGEGADPGDVGKITEGEAWSKYALEGRFEATQARIGVNVFLYGKLWDMNLGGRSLILSRQRVGGVPAVMDTPDISEPCALSLEIPAAVK